MQVSLGAAAARELVQYKYNEDGEVIGRTHVFSNLYYLIFGIFCDSAHNFGTRYENNLDQRSKLYFSLDFLNEIQILNGL